MKTLFLVLVSIINSFSYSQLLPPAPYSPNSNFVIQKSKQINVKNYGDTLWSEDFAGGLPKGWVVGNNRSNNFQWQWDTVYRPGQFSANIPKINSTTSPNGFMVLSMDFFNTPLNAFMAYTVDTYFQSGAIAINSNSSVELRLQQFSRFCCSDRAKVVVQVSTDNFQSFDEYNLNSLFINQVSANVDYTSISVSRTLAYQDTAYLRFYMEGMSHYFWMIDDVALVEGSGQEVRNPNYEIQNGLSIPHLTMFPQNYNIQLSFDAAVYSTVADSISNVNLTKMVHYERCGVGNGHRHFDLLLS